MIGIIIFTITGFLMSVILVITDSHYKNTDEEIMKRLPGYNCGTCGYGSCEGMKEAILENKENYKKCKFIKDQETKDYFENLK